MPNLKHRLSRLEEATHRDCLRQLQAEGIDVEIPEEPQENSRALDTVLAGPGESAVFESATGGVHYAILTRFIAERSGFIVTRWEPSTDHDDQIVPESFNDRHLIFKLGGQEYYRREVLNPRIEKGLVLSRGQIAAGWLLATGISFSRLIEESAQDLHKEWVLVPRYLLDPEVAYDANSRGGDRRSFRNWSDCPPDLQEHTHNAQG